MITHLHRMPNGIAIMNPIVEWSGRRAMDGKIDFNLKSKYVFRYSVVSCLRLEHYSNISPNILRSLFCCRGIACRSS